MVSNCGDVIAVSPAPTLYIFTRTSYHAAWPVIGSELEIRAAPDGSSSEIRWLSKKPFCDSLASGVRFQAPAALPIAFQVHTVPGSTASEWRAMHLTLPHCDSTQIQSPSSMP
jgi:hypothetical protein